MDWAPRSTRNDYDLDFSELHGHAMPFDARETDNVVARVRKREANSKTLHQMQVWDTSERAIELVQRDEDSISLTVGDAVDLEVTISGQRMFFEGLVVDQIQNNEHAKRIGIRYARRIESWAKQERRRQPRWLCSDQFFPVCVATSPFIRGSTTIFQVRDLSTSGMQLACDISRTYLIPQMKIRLTVSFPLVGDFVAPVEIARIGFDSIGGRDVLSVGVRFLSLTRENA